MLKPEPWEEVATNQFKVKFSWNEENRPPVVDTEGTPVTDENTPMYSGSRVAGVLSEAVHPQGWRHYGTSLKLVGVQLVSLNSGAGVDTGDMAAEDVAALFGKTVEGFKANDPAVTVIPGTDEDDFNGIQIQARREGLLICLSILVSSTSTK